MKKPIGLTVVGSLPGWRAIVFPIHYPRGTGPVHRNITAILYYTLSALSPPSSTSVEARWTVAYVQNPNPVPKYSYPLTSKHGTRVTIPLTATSYHGHRKSCLLGTLINRAVCPSVGKTAVYWTTEWRPRVSSFYRQQYGSRNI